MHNLSALLCSQQVACLLETQARNEVTSEQDLTFIFSMCNVKYS